MTDGGRVGYPRVSQMALGVSSTVLRDAPKYTDTWHGCACTQPSQTLLPVF